MNDPVRGSDSAPVTTSGSPTGESGPRSRTAKWLRPRTILPSLAVLLLLAVLFTPSSDLNTDYHLTTYSTGPGGAKGLYEVLGRFGRPTERRQTPFTGALDSNVVYAVLGGPDAMTGPESRALLAAVRRGAGLVYLLDGGPLEDSLPLRRADTTGRLAAIPAADTAGCVNESGAVTYFLVAAGLALTPMNSSVSITDDSVRATVNLPLDTTVFVSVNVGTRRHRLLKPAMVGLAVGRGRVVAVSDAGIMSNDVIRVCKFALGPRVLAAIDYASAGQRRLVVFDEYHQGYGDHPSGMGALTRFLTRHPVGHSVDQLAIGALVLIMALGIRAIAPRTVPTIERRSPLEHVDALARAYEQVRATRTVATRLVKGLRRRHDHGGWSGRAIRNPDTAESAEERFLGAVAETHPRLGPDVKRLLSAEQTSVTPAELLELSAAVDHIDRAFPS
jgi:hypothetical protein